MKGGWHGGGGGGRRGWNKEREHVQEDKRSFHEMKMKMYSLRAQKTELNKRLLEMESTVSSLKEEQKTIESAFEEKQNEAKLFRERYRQVKDQIPRVNALTEMLQQKEAEIEDLKHRLHFPVKEYTSGNENKQESGENSREDMGSITSDVSRYRQMESSTRNERLDENRGEMIRTEKFEKRENSQERSDPQTGESFDVGKKKKNEYETEMNGDMGNEELKLRNEEREAHFGDDGRLEFEGDTQSKRSSNSEVRGDRELGMHRGGVKLELQENSHDGRDRFRGNSDHLDRANGNRWRVISEEIKEKRNYGSNGATITGNQRFVGGKKEDGNRFEEGKTIKQAKIENPHMGLNVQNESVSRNQQSGVADKIANGKHHNVKAKSRGAQYNTWKNMGNSKYKASSLNKKWGTKTMIILDKQKLLKEMKIHMILKCRILKTLSWEPEIQKKLCPERKQTVTKTKHKQMSLSLAFQR
ncbi:hypothetical protein ACJIZ3_010776 [Penstemon smallii]|uniref:Uncharacterized protein n=1 Tax=Penstemon smallii TaxID=265156 RepID=A0ABD3UH94_9LAMI